MRIIELQASPIAESGDPQSAPGETWVDIHKADVEGCRWLAEESGLSEEIVERLLQPPSTTYWRRFGEGRHLQMRAIVPGDDPLAIVTVEFGIWLEPGRLITVRHGDVRARVRTRDGSLRGRRRPHQLLGAAPLRAVRGHQPGRGESSPAPGPDPPLGRSGQNA